MKYMILFENYNTEECDGCKYFDFESLSRYTGFNHPIYNILNKNSFHKLIYISPEEYIKRIAKGFNISYDEVLGAAYNEDLAEKYSKDMLNGDKFPIPDYTIGSDLQEGRHRAMACKMLGVNIIPVVEIKYLSNEEVRKFVLDIKDKTRNELDEMFKNIVPNGVTDLDMREIKNYIAYRL